MKRNFAILFVLFFLGCIFAFAANWIVLGSVFLWCTLVSVHSFFKAYGADLVGSESSIAGFSDNQSYDFDEDFKVHLLAQGDVVGYATGVPSSSLFDD